MNLKFYSPLTALIIYENHLHIEIRYPQLLLLLLLLLLLII